MCTIIKILEWLSLSRKAHHFLLRLSLDSLSFFFQADLKHYLNVRTPPEQHMAYAATWFILTGLMSYIAFRQIKNVNRAKNIVRSVKPPAKPQ